MALANLGSIATTVQAIVENIPTAISGAQLIGMVDRERLFAESFTGDSIGSVNIAAKYQGALVDLTASQVLYYMQLIGADVSSVRLGDLSISKGAGGNLQIASTALKEEGLRKLKELGASMPFYVAGG